MLDFMVPQKKLQHSSLRKKIFEHATIVIHSVTAWFVDDKKKNIQENAVAKQKRQLCKCTASVYFFVEKNGN